MSFIKNYVFKGLYRDSVQLLRVSSEAKKINGVIDAAVVMGTDLNKKILREQGLLTGKAGSAGPDDLIVALRLEEGVDPEMVLEEIMELLQGGGGGEYYYSIESAAKALGGADLALISVPGEHVRELAMELIDKGIHLHIFSDHVPLDDEVMIKRKAVDEGILVMGPEAGTSIISGVGLGFANRVLRGDVGVIAAAGTGLQEYSILLSNNGIGISHGIGVGGRDLWAEVGGLSTLFSINLLERDESTRIITIISKPPSERVAEKILKHLESRTRKKYVVCFMGSGLRGWIIKDRVIGASTLHAAASATAYHYGSEAYNQLTANLNPSINDLVRVAEEAGPGAGYVRGLYTGGTLAYEAQYILLDILGEIYSNAPLPGANKLGDPWRSTGNTIIDLGGEEFTRGRPHPMIDPTIRAQRIIDEARDPSVRVILLDFVLGYGSHPDPVGAHLEAIDKAYRIAGKEDRSLTIIAHVAGTPMDPQGLEEQEEKLRDHGVLVFKSNAVAAIAAGLIVSHRTDSKYIKSLIDKYLDPGVTG